MNFAVVREHYRRGESRSGFQMVYCDHERPAPILATERMLIMEGVCYKSKGVTVLIIQVRRVQDKVSFILGPPSRVGHRPRLPRPLPILRHPLHTKGHRCLWGLRWSPTQYRRVPLPSTCSRWARRWIPKPRRCSTESRWTRSRFAYLRITSRRRCLKQ